MYEKLRALWPYPLYRWPVLMAMLVATSLIGCLGTKLGNFGTGLIAHVAAIFVVLTILGIRTRRRRLDQAEDLAPRLDRVE